MMRTSISRYLVVIALAGIAAGCVTAPPEPTEAPPPETPPVDISEIPQPEPKPEPLSEEGNPVFYEVMGERYHVLLEATEFTQTGMASWYGRKFHGRTTASGEIYDMYALTAAHKTLPLPSYVRVTNLENGREIIVRVNDRGPFHSDRIIDVSYAAAVKLGMIEEGTVRVRIEALTLAGQNVPDDANPALYLQTGAFANAANAHEQAAQLKAMGLAPVFITPTIDATPLYRVRVGPFEAPEALAAAAATLGDAGIASLTLRVDESQS